MVQPAEKRLVTEARLEDAIYEYLDEAETKTKIVPHQVTGPMASSAWPVTAGASKQGAARYPVKAPVSVNRFRIHIRNFSYADNNGYLGKVQLESIFWGKARYNIDSSIDGGFQLAPVQIQNSVALPADGTEWVSGWIESPIEQGTDYLLSLGWSTPASGGALNLVSNWTRNFVSAAAADASIASNTGFSSNSGTDAPFDIWLECEIDASVPVVAYVGDSITVGDMHENCWARRHALQHQIWPAIFGHFGGGLTDWGNGSIERWTHYGSFQADAALVLCGTNDIGSGGSTNDLKNRSNATMNRIRQYLTRRIFFATILPRSDASWTPVMETIRVSHNNWLMLFRSGMLGTVDFARPMASPTDYAVPLSGMLWDNIHPSLAGHVRMADYLPNLAR